MSRLKVAVLLEHAVATLPSRMEQVVRLVFLEGNSQAKAARLMGISRSAVCHAVKRAMELMAARLAGFI